MNYDRTYSKTENYFGTQPETLLRNFYHRLDRSKRVLDLGVGQGRHALFLAREGFAVDAIDPSEVAIESVSALIDREKLPIRTFQCGFENFVPQTDFYGSILIFGLIQILSWESIDLLLEKVKSWTRAGSIVLVRAFSTADPSFARTRDSREWKAGGKNSFTDGQARFRTYMEPGQLPVLFGDYKVIYHREGLSPWHRHADRPPERHAEVEGVFQR
ncbi:methyltransferase domain-containing protein, partial [bacterium]|nr:methyltransferase domain-containing protein [bacterium]